MLHRESDERERYHRDDTPIPRAAHSDEHSRPQQEQVTSQRALGSGILSKAMRW